jgi:hypothetical protein
VYIILSFFKENARPGERLWKTIERTGDALKKALS